jgi:hypothetical protein
MTTKTDYLQCDNCGDDALESDHQGEFFDGQEGICPSCGATCIVSVSEEDPAYINRWICRHGTDGDDRCDQCQMYGITWGDVELSLKNAWIKYVQLENVIRSITEVVQSDVPHPLVLIREICAHSGVGPESSVDEAGQIRLKL